MTRAQMVQSADQVIDRAIQSATTINAVDHACQSLSLAVCGILEVEQGPTTRKERDEIEAVSHAMAMKLLKLVERLHGGR